LFREKENYIFRNLDLHKGRALENEYVKEAMAKKVVVVKNGGKC